MIKNNPNRYILFDTHYAGKQKRDCKRNVICQIFQFRFKIIPRTLGVKVTSDVPIMILKKKSEICIWIEYCQIFIWQD